MIRYQITNGRFSVDRAAWFRTLRDDVDFIQVREKDLSVRDLAALVRSVMQISTVKVLVNDRIDVAIACGAAGVHLRSGSIQPSLAKQLTPMTVTVACHSEDELKSNEGADYLLLAPVFPPRSKPDDRPPLGLEALRRASQMSRVPIIALGGVTEANTPDCIRAGAAGIAGISLWQS